MAASKAAVYTADDWQSQLEELVALQAIFADDFRVLSMPGHDLSAGNSNNSTSTDKHSDLQQQQAQMLESLLGSDPPAATAAGLLAFEATVQVELPAGQLQIVLDMQDVLHNASNGHCQQHHQQMTSSPCQACSDGSCSDSKDSGSSRQQAVKMPFGPPISYLPPICVRATLPAAYPGDSADAPLVQLQACWLSAQHEVMLKQHLQQLWQECKPGPVCYIWLDYLKSSALQDLGIVQELALQPPQQPPQRQQLQLQQPQQYNTANCTSDRCSAKSVINNAVSTAEASSAADSYTRKGVEQAIYGQLGIRVQQSPQHPQTQQQQQQHPGTTGHVPPQQSRALQPGNGSCQQQHLHAQGTRYHEGPQQQQERQQQQQFLPEQASEQWYQHQLQEAGIIRQCSGRARQDQPHQRPQQQQHNQQHQPPCARPGCNHTKKQQPQWAKKQQQQPPTRRQQRTAGQQQHHNQQQHVKQQQHYQQHQQQQADDWEQLQKQRQQEPRLPIDEPKAACTAAGSAGGSGAAAEAVQHELAFMEQLAVQLLRYSAAQQQEAFKAGSWTCGICFDQVPGSTCLRLPDCQHFYCTSCLRSHAASQMESGAVENMRCPEPSCKRMMPPFVVQELLGQEGYERWEDLLFRRTLDKMEDVVYCPRCNAVCIEDKDHCAQCSNCLYVFCTFCSDSWHPGTECLDPIERLRVLERRKGATAAGDKGAELDLINQMMSLKYLGSVSKKCPSCGMATIKNEGCNKMTCSYCRQAWCWKCRQVIEGYDHFKESKCNMFDQEEINRWNALMWQNERAREVEMGQVMMQVMDCLWASAYVLTCSRFGSCLAML
eukprot:GHRR01006044.1.p1 GENE.GHRR01006044.1~~GHRR01006044.1.p1  ORF type:complete len:829 (+),score=331.90 GHRR01006044.1:542-3028(+)